MEPAVTCSSVGFESFDDQTPKSTDQKLENLGLEIRKKKRNQTRRCLDSCCLITGYLCTTWWLLLFLCNYLPFTVVNDVPELMPGVRLKCEGLTARHPVVLVPGIAAAGLELWEGKPCADGLFRQRLWGGGFTQTLKRPSCWLEHLSLHDETGLDPPGIRVRPIPGLFGADYSAPGYFMWDVLIKNLAKIGYEGKNLHMVAYDWRLSFQNTEIRDRSLSRLKSKIELMYRANGYNKVVVVPHSMGVTYFLHFLKWVETPPPIGGGGGPDWCAEHIKAIINVGPAFLGVPNAVMNILSAEGKDVALGLQALEHVVQVSRTWDSLVSLVPKGGETIWGNMDWSPEQGHVHVCDNNVNNSDAKINFRVNNPVKNGRIISFGKAASVLHSSQLPTVDSKDLKIAADKAFTAMTLFDLVRFVAPKMMKRAEAQFSHGIADNLDDPKYNHYKYWSNPLEMKLPYAPDMEIYCSYGVGIPTERSYVYKLSPSNRCKHIPFQIDSLVDRKNHSCLKSGVFFSDGDGNVPVLSAGFMCSKGWRGRTRFNPSGIATYIREYRNKPPASRIERRGANVDVMGNVGLIEDILRIAAGAAGEEIGGDKIYSDILRMSEKINLRL